ncbi:MAG TPA: GGDEF domain-containing protein [Thermoanaerobaculia bacterium]|jgi:diguanylate cyclase (GGDEF)-like protein|nr:GGDEF domain-containing protein [Thermoanaerobaculia bacterium]
MTRQSIGLYTTGGDLESLLRERCAGWTFLAAGEARDGARVVVIDTEAHALLGTPPRRSLVRIILFDGVLLHDRRSGELCIERKHFLSAPESILAFASDLAETAIHASALEQEVSCLTQIQELMTMTETDAVSERITRTVLNILGLSRGTLFLHDPRLERYAVSFSNDSDHRETGEFLPGVPPDVLQRALSSGRFFALDRGEDGRGMIVMPLQSDQDLIGVIKVPLESGDSVDEETTANVARYLTQVAQVLGNIYQLTRSRDLAMRDDLTKAFNRRFFESYLDEEMERSRRYGAIFSIIFLDLDDLKMVNNFYGHLTGSRTLQEVAKRILTAVRTIDKVVRFGGDEFCIILPSTDSEQAVAVANRVRKAMTAQPFRLDADVEISITASFGIATYPAHALTKEDLIRQADAAMYRVKSTTKNAVGVATVEDATRPAPI